MLTAIFLVGILDSPFLQRLRGSETACLTSLSCRNEQQSSAKATALGLDAIPTHLVPELHQIGFSQKISRRIDASGTNFSHEIWNVLIKKMPSAFQEGFQTELIVWTFPCGTDELKNGAIKPGMEVHTWSPSCSGGWGRRICWSPGQSWQLSKIPSQKTETNKKYITAMYLRGNAQITGIKE